MCIPRGARPARRTRRASRELVALLLERLVDPAAVDRAGLDLLDALRLLGKDRLRRLEDVLGLLLRNRDQAVGVAADDVAGVDGHAAHVDRHVDLARSILV